MQMKQTLSITAIVILGMIAFVRPAHATSCSGSVTDSHSLSYSMVVGEDGNCWLDRNLGATRVATASDDAQSYGYLYQWGRSSDGHEATTSALAPFSGVVTTASAVSAPYTADFVATTTSPYDWLNQQNVNLWQGVSGTNNPCPSGFRLPTQTEWANYVTAASITNAATAFSSALKLSVAGTRNYSSGSLYGQGSYGYYWSSSVYSTDAYYLYFSSFGVYPASTHGRAYGFTVRCMNSTYSTTTPSVSYSSPLLQIIFSLQIKGNLQIK